jgi:hypothetical protein
MRNSVTTATVLLTLCGLFATARVALADDIKTDIVSTPGPTAAADTDAIRAALALLPRRPVRVAVTDVSLCRPPVREYLLTLDAFTVHGNGVVYIVQQSAVLKGARSGSALYRAMLAAILWHEMAHLAGADERRARTAEEDVWRSFVRDGVTDQLTGLRYLDLLTRRPDDTLLASRNRNPDAL